MTRLPALRSTSLAATLAASLTLGLAGCATGGDGGPHRIPEGSDGKGDNYISSTAQEYLLSGAAHVTLPEGFDTLDAATQAATLDELVQKRLSLVSRAITAHIDQVIRDSNGGVTGEEAKYFTFFKRDSSNAEPATVLGDGRARFEFEMEFVGSLELIRRVATDGGTFAIEVKESGEPTGEQVTVAIQQSPSKDAFPPYDALFADGALDIAIHFGGDYNDGRYDLETARWTIDYLKENGFKNAGATGYDDLKIDSPAWIRTLTLEGRPFEVRVSVYHAEMDGGGDQTVLGDAMKKSLAERDVVIYSGHAGPGAGFILDYHPKYEIPARDFATLELSANPQIYVFDGCQTYRTYVDDLLKNPGKSFDNLDVVTTINTTPFSVGYQVIHEFVTWLTLTDNDGRHYPLSWMTLLAGINGTEAAAGVHYGVHGIDSNARLNPHGSDGIACRACERDADCGPGGNLCLALEGGSACGVACTTDEACGDGYRCVAISEDPDEFYLPKQCMRHDQRCE